jgi:hypothetical protein
LLGFLSKKTASVLRDFKIFFIFLEGNDTEINCLDVLTKKVYKIS